MQSVQTVDVQGSPMEVLVFTPPETGKHPGIVLAQHLPVGHTGLENDSFTLATAERYAAHGYVVAVPFLFHWWPKTDPIEVKFKESRDDRMVADVQAAFALLAARSDVNAARIGIVGHCWGGRVAWLGACHIPELAACVMFYGGRIKLGMGAGSTPPIQLAARIRCPVAGFYGNEDQNPPPEDVDDYEKALSAAGVTHEFHRYDGAGHAFQNFPTPERYRQAQSEDAWAKALDFLAEHLGGTQAERSGQSR